MHCVLQAGLESTVGPVVYKMLWSDVVSCQSAVWETGILKRFFIMYSRIKNTPKTIVKL